jgi:hypothetical protein
MGAVRGAAAGLAAATVAGLLTRLNGLNSTTVLAMLYMYVGLGAVLSAELDAPTDLLDRIVIVTEGEALKMRKLLSGERYKIKGEVEKL